MFQILPTSFATMSRFNFPLPQSKSGDVDAQVLYTLWAPTNDINKPLGDINKLLTPYLMNLIDGYKSLITQSCVIPNQELCPMCDSGKAFVDCCKEAHIKRKVKI